MENGSDSTVYGRSGPSTALAAFRFALAPLAIHPSLFPSPFATVYRRSYRLGSALGQVETQAS